MSKFVIGIDVDDVLVDFNVLIVEEVNKRFNVDYRLNDVFVDFTNMKDEHRDYAFDLFTDEAIFNKIALKEGAKDFVDTLSSLVYRGKKVDIVFVTSVFPSAIPYRDAFLKYNFPNLANSIIYTKRKDLVNADILVEDHPVNVYERRGYSILLDKPWNRPSNMFEVQAEALRTSFHHRVATYAEAIERIESHMKYSEYR